MSSVSRGGVQRASGGVSGVSGECEAIGRGLVLCVEAYGLVVRLHVCQRRFRFLGGVIVGVCIGAVDGGRGGGCMVFVGYWVGVGFGRSVCVFLA